MEKSKVLILHESASARTSLEQLGLYLLQEYDFEFKNILDYLKVNFKIYDFIVFDSYNEYVFEYFKEKVDRIIVSVNILKEERPSDYIKKGYKQFNIYKVPVVDRKNNILGTMGIAKDITDLKNKDVKFDILLENMPFAVFTKNRTGDIIQSNSMLYKLTSVNKSSYFLLKEEHLLGDEYKKSIEIEDNDVIHNKTDIALVRTLKTKNGEKIVEVFKSPIIDISGEVIGIICTMRDVTEIKNQEAKIKEMAYTDYLTRLANRRGLYNYVESYLIKKYADVTIMFIDLDNFKSLNDSFGHQHGDRILIEFGEDLQTICKDGFVSRIGGDEFVIVWEGRMNKEIATEMAEKILNLLSGKKRKFNKISASIGIVTGNMDEETIDNFLTKGDLALYKAKDQSKNQYVFYNQDLDKKRCLNEEIEQDLRNALDKNELELHYQPQYTCDKELMGS